MTLILKATVSDDSTIEDTAEALQRMADTLLCVIECEFNGCLLLAGLGGSADMLVLRYKQTIAKAGRARVVSSYRPKQPGEEVKA